MANNQDKLESCPFCGSDNVSQVLMPGFSWIVGCNECGCRTSEYTHSADAVTAWNRRADQKDDTRSVEDIMADMGMSSMKETPF
ncbi:MAG: Lar family restriction alleviation protein [Synergistaceae bacterium]|nr:Lar family restriction alleviation protein [Synergistaceae bacterium]